MKITMEYRVTMIYNRSTFINFVKAFKLRNKFSYMLLMLLSLAPKLIGGAFVLIGVINAASFIWMMIIEKSLTSIYLFLIPIIFTITGLSILFRVDYKKLDESMWEKYNYKGDEVTYNFYQDYFIQHMKLSEHKLDYQIIESIYEDKFQYYLFINESIAHIIDKNGFKIGDSEQFAKFISERTGHGINKIK